MKKDCSGFNKCRRSTKGTLCGFAAYMDEHLELFFFTDLRSSKISQLNSNPRVSLLLFDPVDKIQVIVEGSARVYHQSDLTRQFWNQIPDALRKPYSPIARPGTEIQLPEDAHEWPENITDEYFAVIKVSPEKFEVLEINGLAHYRAKFSIGNGWQGMWLAP